MSAARTTAAIMRCKDKETEGKAAPAEAQIVQTVQAMQAKAVLPPVRIERRRIKNINLYLRPPYEEILVTAPLRMPMQRIEAFLSDREGWIERNLKRLRTERRENRLDAALSEAERKQFRQRLDNLLPNMIETWERRMGVHAQGIGYRKMRRCFGICHTGKRTITFNIFLGEAPERLIEYIVVHELCHLLEPSHNRRFHHFMDVYLPDWKNRKREINAFYTVSA